MKKASMIISGLFTVICLAIILATGGAIIHVSLASIAPLAMAAFILFFSLTDIRFRDSGREMLHTSDADIPYAERVVLYRHRGLTFMPVVIPEIFFVFCLPDLAKIILAALALMVGLGVASVVGALSIREMAYARYAEEEAERKRQLEREACGKWKK